MPDSFSTSDMKRLRALYPDPPYRRYPYQYTYFGMGGMGAVDPTTRGIIQTDVQEVVGGRRLVQSRQHPVLRLRRHENVSRKQPYSFYDDPEVKRDIPDDGWPFVSYYYLMDVDTRGKPVAITNKNQINVRSSRLRGDYVSPRDLQLPNRTKQMEHPTGTTSFLSLENI